VGEIQAQVVHFNEIKMVVKQDIRTVYDLGGNPTEVKFYDNLGLAYTETRTYARGYQLTGATFSDVRADVTVSTSGSYTYDTNNNITGTKKADAHITSGGLQLSYRAQWTFTYDRKNRLKTHTNTGALNVRGNLWYDGLGRVWQRWNDTLGTFAATLKRNVYDGSQLIQEHTFAASQLMGAWVYTYSDITRDYLRHPAGLRQREGGATSYSDWYLGGGGGSLEEKVSRGGAGTIAVTDRSQSLDRISGGTFNDLSHLATSGQFIESYGGGTTGSSAGFDPLVQRGGRGYSAGLNMHSTRKGNGPYSPHGDPPGEGTPIDGGGGGGLGVPPGSGGGMDSPPNGGGGLEIGVEETAASQIDISVPWLRRGVKSWSEHVNDCCNDQWWKRVPGDYYCNFLNSPFSYCCQSGPCRAIFMIIECQDLRPFSCQDYLCGTGYDVEGGGPRHCLCDAMRTAGWDQVENLPFGKNRDKEIFETMEQFRRDCGISTSSPWEGTSRDVDDCIARARLLPHVPVNIYIDTCVPESAGGGRTIQITLDPEVCCRLDRIERLGVDYCAFIAALLPELTAYMDEDCCFLVWLGIKNALEVQCGKMGLL
jgi:hypothetical protein